MPIRARDSAGYAFWGLRLVILIAVAATGWWYSGHGPRSSVDAAGVILVIGAVSVAIERSIEYIWTLVGLLSSSFWPMTAIAAYVGTLTARLDEATAPLFVNASGALAFLREKQGVAEGVAVRAQARLDELHRELARLRDQARTAQQIESYAAAATDVVNLIQSNYSAYLSGALGAARTADERLALARALVATEARLAEARRLGAGALGGRGEAALTARSDEAVAEWLARLPADPDARAAAVDARIDETGPGQLGAIAHGAGLALDELTTFLDSFRDNPGKRLLSIQLGILAGIVVAAVAGLDVYAGVMNQDASAPDALRPVTVVGVLLTGLLMGLGSAPTHEVIRALQEFKQAQKAATAVSVEMEPAVAPRPAPATRTPGAPPRAAPAAPAMPFEPVATAGGAMADAVGSLPSGRDAAAAAVAGAVESVSEDGDGRTTVLEPTPASLVRVNFRVGRRS